MKSKLPFNFSMSFATTNPEKKEKRLKNLLALLVMVMGTSVSWGQVSITSIGTAFTENFTIGASATATLPSGFKMMSYSASPDWSTGTSATALAYGSTGTGIVTSTSTGGIINWANGVTASSTDRAIGFMNSGSSNTNPSHIILKFTNNTGVTITTLNIAFDYEKYRSGIRQCDWTFFHGSSTNPTTSASGGDQSYIGDANNTVISNPPATVNKSFTLSSLSIANGNSYYLKWSYTPLAGGSNGQGIGIDNFSITAVASAPTVTSSAASSLATTTATLNGNVTSDGGATVTDRGFVYKTTAGATISDNKTTVTGTTGAFTLTPTLLVNTQYFFKAYAINSVNTTLSTPELSFYTLANTPSAPTVNNPTTTSLDVAINVNSNPNTTEFTIQETGGSYVQANGTLSATAVWQTASAWGTKTVTGLSPSTTYTFQVKARNGANTETAFGTTANVTTSASSTPTISGGATAVAFTTTYGTESGVQTFAISGTNLTTDITATAPTGFLVSSDGTSYGATATFSQPGGGTVNGSLRIKLAATAAVTGSYNSQNIVLSAAGATNVNISTSASGNSVTAAVLTVTGLSTTNKIYDRTTAVVINGTVAFSNLQNGESFIPNGSVTWAFADALVGINKTLTRTGTYVTPSSNYTVTQPSLTATISVLTLTTNGTASVITKTYDSNTTASLTGVSLVGVISPDVVTISGTYDDKTVNTGKAVTLSLSGADSANYSWTAPSGVTGNITSATIIVTSPAVTSKPFDGTTSATITGTLSGVLVGDIVTLNGTGTFASSAIANGISVTSTSTLSGADAGNYTLTQPTGLSGNITALIIAGWNFFGNNAAVANIAATTFDSNLVSTSSASNITRGAGAAASAAGNSFRTGGFQNNGISTSNNDYFQITLTATSGYLTSLSSIDAKFAGTGTFCASPGVSQQFAYSLDGTNFNLIGSPQIIIGTPGTLSQIDLSGVSALQNVAAGTTITIRYYASGQTTTGGWGFNSPSIATSDNGLSIGGTVLAIPPTNNWIGGSSTWNTPANWSLSQVPLSTDNITINNGSPVMDVSHTLAAGRTLTISGTGTLTINPGITLSISGTADFGGKSVIFKSDATGSARLAQVTGTLLGATNVKVERYIPLGKRAYRFLAPGVTTTNYISNNWQLATHITGSTTGANGFDQTGSGSPSMYTYNNQVGTGTGWTVIANTNATNLEAEKGYRLLVRGDRTPALLTTAAADNMNTAITFSATGTLKTGDVTINASSTPVAINNTNNATTNGFSLVGNPYVSPIDWHTVTKTNLNDTYYLWDANVGTSSQRGRYVSYSQATGLNNYGNTGVSVANRYIQSGQAFFVKNAVLGTAGSLTFHESDKVTSSPFGFRTDNQQAVLSVLLYSPTELALGGYPMDGITSVFGANFDNQIGYGDVAKLESAGENIAWYSQATKLDISAQAPVVSSDVLAIKSLRLGANKSYTFRIKATNFDPSLTGYLVDNYLNTQQEIDMSQDYFATFTTSTEALSYGEDRFKIVFGASLENEQFDSKSLTIYPNPVIDNQFSIQLPASLSGKLVVKIHNTLGQELHQVQTDTVPILLVNPPQVLAAGMYIVSVSCEGKDFQQKIMVK